MFSGKILAEARAASVTVQVIRDPARMDEHAQSPARLLLVDLNLPGAIEAAAAWRDASQAHDRLVIGFVSHVDTPTIAQARQAGLDHVLPRGKFVQVLPEILKSA
jgi:DNA-binding NarL/FixJ family response regulator